MPVTISCDRCGETCVERARILTVLGWRRAIADGANRVILCEGCNAAFRAWLSGGGVDGGDYRADILPDALADAIGPSEED